MPFMLPIAGGGQTGVQPVADQTGQVTSFCCFGFGVGAGIGRHVIGRDEFFSATTNVFEKTDTLEPAQTSIYVNDQGATFYLRAVVRIVHNDFNCAAWHALPGRVIKQDCEQGHNPIGLGYFWFAGSISHNTSMSFREVPPASRRIQRTCRRGIFNMLGNSSIRRHAKTGKGAFSQPAPQFTNDMAWQDGWSWRLGADSTAGQGLLQTLEVGP